MSDEQHWHLDKEATDPLAKEDPAFVSLTKT